MKHCWCHDLSTSANFSPIGHSVPMKCAFEKKLFFQPKQSYFWVFSDFNLKLLWYVCFPMDFFVTYQKICVFLRPAFLTSWKIEAIFKDLRASEESVFWPVGQKSKTVFFKYQPFRNAWTDFWVQQSKMFLRSSSFHR